MRLFAGLALSTAAVERLSAFRLRVAAPQDGLRWSSAEQWHIPLCYFGDVGITDAKALQEALLRLQSPWAALHMERFGAFMAKGLLFAEVESTPALQSLCGQLQGVAAAYGVVPEWRPFHPHVTLARSKNRTGLATIQRLCVPTHPAFGAALDWQAEELLCYESVLQRDGAAYHVLSRVALQPPKLALACERGSEMA